MEINYKYILTIDRFYINLLDLIDLIREILPKNHDKLKSVIILAKEYVKNLSSGEKETFIQNFISKSEPYWNDDIYNKKTNFFIKNGFIFFPSIGNGLKVINEIIGNEKIISNDDRDEVWEYIHSFVKQSIKYIHEKRKPTHVLYHNKYQKVYSEDFMDKIPLSIHAVKWDVSLTWTKE
uniref:Uncharacterized protein n=1 Tax=Pithovirus LCPAC001 TaxID=2506585 RepID=A0A481Z3R0_9VIRU|nr:MAG: uncharacterized protein LCPAC001_01910 [Pithovirus LCPAC001]